MQARNVLSAIDTPPPTAPPGLYELVERLVGFWWFLFLAGLILATVAVAAKSWSWREFAGYLGVVAVIVGVLGLVVAY